MSDSARQFGVLQNNKNKFFVVDESNGTPVTDIAALIDPKGYATNKEAWEAITGAALRGHGRAAGI